MSDEATRAAEVEWPATFPLRKAISAYGEDTKTLKLREPTGDEVIKHGLLNGLDPQAVVGLIMDLGAVPESSVKTMDARDLIKLSAIFSRFFGAAARLDA